MRGTIQSTTADLRLGWSALKLPIAHVTYLNGKRWQRERWVRRCGHRQTSVLASQGTGNTAVVIGATTSKFSYTR